MLNVHPKPHEASGGKANPNSGKAGSKKGEDEAGSPKGGTQAEPSPENLVVNETTVSQILGVIGDLMKDQTEEKMLDGTILSLQGIFVGHYRKVKADVKSGVPSTEIFRRYGRTTSVDEAKRIFSSLIYLWRKSIKDGSNSSTSADSWLELAQCLRQNTPISGISEEERKIVADQAFDRGNFLTDRPESDKEEFLRRQKVRRDKARSRKKAAGKKGKTLLSGEPYNNEDSDLPIGERVPEGSESAKKRARPDEPVTQALILHPEQEEVEPMDEGSYESEGESKFDTTKLTAEQHKQFKEFLKNSKRSASTEEASQKLIKRFYDALVSKNQMGG
jgi:hypothetical protein